MQRTHLARHAERLRWWLAAAINRLPGQCWAGLAGWALDRARTSRRNGHGPLPWRPISDTCRWDAAENNGYCWCSKIHPAGVEGAGS